MSTNGEPANGGWRHPWRWFLVRGLGLFALGFLFAWVSGWLDAPWLAWIGFGLAITAMWMLSIASGEARRRQITAWRTWYRTAYERNVRAAEQRAANESPPRRAPDDR